MLTKEEFLQDKELYLKKIREGAVFIYPTDTIYGIGCNALKEEAVARIRKLKKREKRPFSVIAPNVDWILDHFELSIADHSWLQKLPGPYTIVLEQKDRVVSSKVNPGLNTLGVRIPDHWFSKIVQELGIPVVTTSVNKTGEVHMTSTENMDEEIGRGVDFVIYEGSKVATPSTIVDLSQSSPVLKKR